MLTRASQRLLLAGAALATHAGAQEFGPAQVAGSLQGVTPLEVADLDGDGLLDLLVSTPNLFTVRWHRGLGSGTFAGAQSVMGARSSRLALADFDADGDLDVFALDLDRIRLAENLGGGSFALPDVVQTPFQVLDVAVGDLDGDGDGDLAPSCPTLRGRRGAGGHQPGLEQLGRPGSTLFDRSCHPTLRLAGGS